MKSTVSANQIEKPLAAAAAESDEWKAAKPYEDIPVMSMWDVLRNFVLPGGKYKNLDTTEMMNMFYKDLGNIGKIKGTFGQQDFVMTHDPKDFERVLRSEGIWPNRPGNDGLHYHRSVHRKEFFQGVEGLLST